MNTMCSIHHDVATTAMRAQWDKTARGWRDSGAIIRPWLAPATQAMLGMAGVGPGAYVLDVAAGAGDQTLDVAERIGPEGYVLATDSRRRSFNSQPSEPPPLVISTRFGRAKTGG